MLIIESEHERIAVLGCCRVMRPLLALGSQGRIKILFDAAANFTYGVSDALQYRDVIMGRRRIPAEMEPFVYSGPVMTDELLGQARALLKTCDTVILEIGMQRLFSYDGIVLQFYLMVIKLMGDMGEEGRGWYRRLLYGDVVDVDMSRLSPLQLDMAARIEMFTNSVSDMAAGIRSIGDGKRCIVATHLLWGDAPVMAERALRVHAVMEAAALAGAEIFDPAIYLVEGALEDDEHYTPDFTPVMGEHLLRAASARKEPGRRNTQQAFDALEAAVAARTPGYAPGGLSHAQG